MPYNYNLHSGIEEDISEKQAEELLEKGFEFNSNANTYDLYEEKKEKIKYFHLSYNENVEVEVPLVEIEVYETKKVKDVEYKVEEKGIFGFFKKLTQKFFPKKELNVSEERITQLERMLAQGEIYDLSVKEKIASQKTVKRVSQTEMTKIDTPFTFLRKTKETIKELQKQLNTVDIPEDERDDYDEYEIVHEEMYEVEKVVEKIVVERRKRLTITQDFYVPGIWSKDYNHEEGTKASFVGTVTITYLSGYNPYDERYVNVNDLKEKLIDIIGNEHQSSRYIRERRDRQDGFNLEESKIIK